MTLARTLIIGGARVFAGCLFADLDGLKNNGTTRPTGDDDDGLGGGAALHCDAKEGCGSGEVCCFAGGGAGCSTGCPGPELCHGDGVRSGGKSCSATGPGGFRACQ